jgi:Zn-dependent protease
MEAFDFYPEKPDLKEVKVKKNTSRTFFSIVLFVLSLLLVFSDSLNFIIYLVIVLLIHELGHFSMMKLFKYENVRLLFVPLMGAFVQGKKDEYKQKQSILVIVAGPLPGIIIGSVLVYIGSIYQLFSLIEIGFLFLFLNMMNLLPLDPLDGGHILRILVNSSQELFQLIFSFISSLFLILIGLYLNEWVIVIFGFLMGLRVRAIQKNYQIHKELKTEKVNYTVSYKLLSNRDFSKIKEVILSYSPSLRLYVDQLPEEETNPIIASQVNNVLVTPLLRDASLIFKLMTILVWIAALVLPVYLVLNLDLKAFIDAL